MKKKMAVSEGGSNLQREPGPKNVNLSLCGNRLPTQKDFFAPFQRSSTRKISKRRGIYPFEANSDAASA